MTLSMHPEHIKTVKFTSGPDHQSSYNKTIRIHPVQSNVKITTIKNDIK